MTIIVNWCGNDLEIDKNYKSQPDKQLKSKSTTNTKTYVSIIKKNNKSIGGVTQCRANNAKI